MSGQKQSAHAVVADQRPDRRLEGGRLVLLDEEMGEPGEGVTADRHGQQPPPVLRGHRPDQHGHRGDRADVVDGARLRLAVLTQIEGPEFIVGAIGTCHDTSLRREG